MPQTSVRLLRLLSLLQTPGNRTGSQLAEKLGVTTGTIRKDIERLRGLGYPIHPRHGRWLPVRAKNPVHVMRPRDTR